MRTPRSDRTSVLLWVGFAVLAAAVIGTIFLALSQQQAFKLLTHTLEVDNKLWTVLSRMQDAETGQRGFLLTGRNEFLAPYNDALAQFDADLAALEAAVADNPSHRKSVERLRTIAHERQELLRTVISDFRPGQSAEAPLMIRGKELMDEIRSIVGTMRADEERLQQQRSAAVDLRTYWLMDGLIVSALAVALLGFLAIRNANARLAEVTAAHDALAHANVRLENEAASRQTAEMQMRQMQKIEAVGQLTGGIAHDFNNMLAIIFGSLDIARRRLTGAEDARIGHCIDNAMEGAQRASQLTSRLLAFSRQQPLSPQPLDVNKLVGGMSELLRRSIGEHLRVETVLAGGLWRSYIDPAQLEQAIMNLCVNARDAMPGGGSLTIETSNAYLDDDYAAAHAEVTSGQYVLISVTDTGTGMPNEVAERAFDPFYTTKGVGKGTGLGLSQVHGFVKQSNGHVKIYSEPGQGSTIKIYLPRFYGDDVGHPEARHDSSPAAALPRARDGEIVLLVEDDERVRHTSVDSLRELGYTVVHASDGAQALTVLTLQPRIDLLFTDIVMPGMNGRQLADLAREQRPDLKVLYTTGYTKNAIVHNGVLDADVAMLPKPFSIGQLAVSIRRALDAG
ncbi:MAG TPA: CHASE3 domain-containing protein [Tardiphaga sp.]